MVVGITIDYRQGDVLAFPDTIGGERAVVEHRAFVHQQRQVLPIAEVDPVFGTQVQGVKTIIEGEDGDVVVQLAVGVIAVSEIIVAAADAVEGEVARFIAIDQVPDMAGGDAVGVAVLDGEVEEGSGVAVVRDEGAVGEHRQIVHLRSEGKIGAVAGGPGFAVGGVEGVVVVVEATESYVGAVNEPDQGAADGDIPIVVRIGNQGGATVDDQRDRLRGEVSIKITVDDRVAHLPLDTDMLFGNQGEKQLGDPILLWKYKGARPCDFFVIGGRDAGNIEGHITVIIRSGPVETPVAPGTP